MTQMGRPSIFSPKADTQTVRALGMTKRGRQLFEAARTRLQKLTNWPGKVSDADVIEYLVRGPAETATYLQRK